MGRPVSRRTEVAGLAATAAVAGFVVGALLGGAWWAMAAWLNREEQP
jgi:hypothetical protein